MKNCIRCQALKPLSDFYKHKHTVDGHLGACKECQKADVLRLRAANVEHYRAYDKARYLAKRSAKA